MFVLRCEKQYVVRILKIPRRNGLARPAANVPSGIVMAKALTIDGS
jgi:hypothetical protein